MIRRILLQTARALRDRNDRSSSTASELKISEALTVKSRLRVHNGTILVETPRRRPNCWRRLWYWALLGWTWEKVS